MWELRGGRGGAVAGAVALLVTLAGCTVGPGTGQAGTSPATSLSTTSAPASTTPPSTSAAPGYLIVAGHRIPAADVTSVGAAVARAGVRVPDGRLLSVLGDRVLNPHADPAVILVDGRRASLTSSVRAGDVITFLAGRDRVEPTRTVVSAVSLDPGAAALYVSVRPGSSSDVQGAISGEQVSSTLRSAPRVGRLRAPATVAYTFDDGPDPAYTGRVMSLLAVAHVPAVFCLIGVDALRYPSLARTEAEAGYRLCDHTQTHPLKLPELPADQILWQIRTGEQSIHDADGGIAATYFRAPGGNWSPTVIADARALHLVPLSWTVDPRDWSRPGTQQIVLTVLNELRPGGIVLMHDGGGDRSQTVAALAELLPELAAAGWTPTYPTAAG